MNRSTPDAQCCGRDGKVRSTPHFKQSMHNKPNNSHVKVELPTKQDNNQKRSEPLMKRSEDFDRIEKINPLVATAGNSKGK
tara:strand:+ start:9638 stop:9880 length:243 start_codon:yes stop_codon:yes gene_type:complete